MDDGQPPGPDRVETCDCADMLEHEPKASPAVVAPVAPVAPDLKVAAASHNEGGGPAASAADGTLALPDEVLMAVFNFCDARTQMMAIPAVSKRWHGVCQMRRAAIDLTWAHIVNGRRCAITDDGLAGLVRRFPKLWRLDLSWCKNVTDGGLTAVAAGCPNLQHLNLRFCVNVTDVGAALFPNAKVYQ